MNIRGSLLGVLLGAGMLYPRAFYVRPDGSNDGDGRTESTAWADIAKVGEYAWNPGFVPGDSILFLGGVTHTTSQGLYMQADRCSGTEAEPILIGSYGNGRAVIEANGCTFLEVWAPDVSSGSGTVAFALAVENLTLAGNGVARSGPENADGIVVWNSSVAGIDLLHITDCDIHGFAGNGIESGRDDKSKGRIRNVLISGVRSYDNAGAAGVSPHTGSGIVVGGAEGAVIEHCVAYNNGSNNDNPGGPIGIWFWDCINSTIQYCESYDNRTTHGDGGGFDLDGGCEGCVIQYSYSHGNAGAGYLLAQFGGALSRCGPLRNNVIRYNISENDGRKGSFGGISFWGASSTDHVGANCVHNNTIYMGDVPDNGSPSCIHFLGRNARNVKIFNNILIAADGHRLINSGASFDTTDVHFYNNAYWNVTGSDFSIKWGSTGYATLGGWRETGQESLNGSQLGMAQDPLLVDPGHGGTVSDPSNLASLSAYRMTETSPLRDAGLDIPEFGGIAPAGYDFRGTAVPQNGAYDIGAHEFQPSTASNSTGYVLTPRRDRPARSAEVYDLLGRGIPMTSFSYDRTGVPRLLVKWGSDGGNARMTACCYTSRR